MSTRGDALLLVAGAGLIACAWWLARQLGATAPGGGARSDGGGLGAQLDQQLAEAGAVLVGWSERAADAAGEIVAAVIPGMWSPPAGAAPYIEYINAAEARHGIPHNFLARIAHQESAFRADVINGKVRGGVGEIGMYQMRPEYAEDFGIDPLELTDPYVATDAAAAYFAKLYARFGSWGHAIAAWNWGPTALARNGLDRAPQMTKDYMAGVLRDVGIA